MSVPWLWQQAGTLHCQCTAECSWWLRQECCLCRTWTSCQGTSGARPVDFYQVPNNRPSSLQAVVNISISYTESSRWGFVPPPRGKCSSPLPKSPHKVNKNMVGVIFRPCEWKRYAQWSCSSSGYWKELHLNWSIGHLLIVIKTICVEAILPHAGLSHNINRIEIGWVLRKKKRFM